MNNRNIDINLIFPTPIWTTILPDFEQINIRMIKYIDGLKNTDPVGKKKSNLIGWHSHSFNLQDSDPKFFVNSISPMLNESLNDMGWDLKKNILKITSMWTIINPTNASNSRHIHSNNFISAAYYIKSPENSGNIVFHDPRSAKVIMSPLIGTSNKLNSTIFSVTPKEGLLVLFPSYLHHSVEINNSDSERIVISFNLNLIEKSN